MSEVHTAYLSLGSNIEPETNLLRAVERLRRYGRIESLSSAWESESVGAEGPNYLNACLALVTSLSESELKQQALLPIESELGRQRSADPFAPRTMDIDIVVFDDRPCDNKYWSQAFVVIPLAEIHPDFQNPLTRERIHTTATRLRQQTWMEARPELFRQFSGGASGA